MAWTVNLTKQTEKQFSRLPQRVKDALGFLMTEIEAQGPVRGNWPNYGKLGQNKHHCHLKKGKPCYVAIWLEVDGAIKLIEVTYAGTHERAPY